MISVLLPLIYAVSGLSACEDNETALKHFFSNLKEMGLESAVPIESCAMLKDKGACDYLIPSQIELWCPQTCKKGCAAAEETQSSVCKDEDDKIEKASKILGTPLSDCGRFEEMGGCSYAAEQAAFWCPKTCKAGCGFVCEDKQSEILAKETGHASCAKLKEIGGCEFLFPEMIAFWCPMTCQKGCAASSAVESAVCEDRDDLVKLSNFDQSVVTCSDFAMTGGCDSLPPYASHWCPKTCEAGCGLPEIEVCEDNNKMLAIVAEENGAPSIDSCDKFAKINGCKQFVEDARALCPKTCEFCD